MNGNIDYEEQYEIIEGEKIIVAPSATCEHNSIVGNLTMIFKSYFRKNQKGKVFTDSLDVHLPDSNVFRPDLSVVCDRSILKAGGAIYGVPDLVVEILSYSTMRRDIGIKKTIYERNGVKEYWIIDQWSKRVEVYHLKDGKFELDDVYKIYSVDEMSNMPEEEREKLKYEIKVSIFDDLLVDIGDIFYDI